MSQSQQELQDQLDALHRTLDEHPQLDAESLILLQQIAADVERLGGNVHPGLSDLIQEQAVEFETEYPVLAKLLQQLVETLAQMGV